MTRTKRLSPKALTQPGSSRTLATYGIHIVVLVSVTACTSTRCPEVEAATTFSPAGPTTLSVTQAEPLIDSATRHVLRVCRVKVEDLILLGVVEREHTPVVQLMHAPTSKGYDIAVDPATLRVTSFRAWSP